MKHLLLFSVTLLVFGTSIAQINNLPNKKNLAVRPQNTQPAMEQKIEPTNLPDRENYPPAPKENWVVKPQFTVDPNYNPNYWHTLEHSVDDTLFWNNVQKNRLIIMIEDGYNEKDLTPFLELNNLIIVKRGLNPEIMNFLVVDVPNISTTNILNIIKTAKEFGSIKCAELEGKITSLSCIPNDTYYSSLQWGPYQIWADSAWCYVYGNSGNWVAVIDDAVDWYHPDLNDNVWYGYDFADNDNDPTPASPSNSHGTHVTGTVAATINNGTGIAGMINDTVYFAKVFTDGPPSVSLTSYLLSALNTIAGISQIKVINMSLGSTVYSASVETACINNWNVGKLLIAASGNDGVSPVMYPAQLQSVVAVGSIESSYALSSFSNFGSQQEVVAPGGDLSAGPGDILSTLPSSNYGFMAGTSMASPHVTGLGALLFAANPCMTNVVARQILQQNVVDLGSAGWDSFYGYGLIQAHLAVIAALPPSASIISSTNVTCNGGNNGKATVNVNYGFPPFTYLWSSGSTSSSATNLIAGWNTVTVTDALGCTSASNVFLTQPSPVPANAGNNVAICVGNNTTLSASGGVSYSWSPTTGINNPNISNPIANPSTSTNYTVTVTNGSGCSATDAVLVTVNPLPLANAGTDASICIGNNTTLNASGGINYIWSPTTALSNPNIANPIANPTSTISYTVTVTNGNGCVKSDGLTITVNQLPSSGNVTGSVSPCETTSQTYTATSTGATSYIWNLPLGWSGLSTTSTINVTVGNGSGSVCATPVNSCGNGTQGCQSATVSLLPTIATVSGNLAPNQGASETYSASSIGATSYIWSLPSGWTGSSTTNTINVTVGSTSGNVCATPLNSCGNGTQGCQSISIITGIENFTSLKGIVVFPNPNDGSFNINIADISTLKEVRIIDALGKIIFKENTKSNNYFIKNIASGLYSVTIEFEEQTIHKKVIVN